MVKQHLFEGCALRGRIFNKKGAAMNKQIEKYHSRLNGVFITKIFLTLVVVLIFFILPVLAYSADVTLAWDANNEPDLAGYKLHFGTSSGNYSSTVDVGDILQHTFTGLNEGPLTILLPRLMTLRTMKADIP